MALVNEAMREINAKVVFFGPGLAGKATNLKYIYGKLKPEFRGKMKAMSVPGGRMLFFDFTPPGEAKVQGYLVRIHVYTISGESVDPASWRVALKGADGVVFVADANADRAAYNSRSLEELEAALGSYGLTLASRPVVFQYNKSEVAGAASKEDLDRLLNPSGFPSFTTSSGSGVGVLQTLLTLVKSVLVELRAKKGVAEGMERRTEVSPAPPAPPLEAAGPAPEEAGGGAAAEEEPLSVELSDEVEVVGAGRISLPLTIRSGARSRSVTLNLTLSLDQD